MSDKRLFGCSRLAEFPLGTASMVGTLLPWEAGEHVLLWGALPANALRWVGMQPDSSAYLARLIGLLSRYLTNTPEVLVLAAQPVHERIGVFGRDVFVSMQMEGNRLKRGLMAVMHNCLPCWLKHLHCSKQEVGKRSAIGRFFGRLVLFFHLQHSPVCGRSAIARQVALTYTATILVASAAQYAGRLDLIRSPKRVFAQCWEALTG